MKGGAQAAIEMRPVKDAKGRQVISGIALAVEEAVQ